MILSAGQPYFAPFPGFFYKILRSDFFVLLDDVQFPRKTTWITRNRFKNDQGTLWMTIPVFKKGLGLRKINTVRIFHEHRWATKHLASLKNAYGKAPYFRDHLDFVTDLFSSKIERLIDINLAIIRYLLKQLNIHTRVLLLSELDIQIRGNPLLIEICRQTGASCYLAQRPAQKYIQPEGFEKAGIRLEFVRIPELIYPQLWGDFIPNLSTFDLIFNCGPKARDILTVG
jgi:hypothetical protein